MINTTISHYKILQKLGEGGMGVVYKAEDTKLKRVVALKFLPSRLISSDEDIIRFQQEAEAISALNHPHIATIHDVVEIDGQRFLVLEYLPGGTLEEKMKQLRAEEKQFPIDDVLEYGIQIAEGLGHAHRHQIIHRDVKTANMMLTEEGKVKITDFGLAKLQSVTGKTSKSGTVGTIAYMSPEQIHGGDVDHRSDIFSLGIVLYELITSHLPFRAVHEAALTYSIMNEDPARISSHRSDITPSLEDVITKCLDKDKTWRYQNADDIVVALKEVRQEISGVTRTVIRKSKLTWIIAALIVVLAIVAFYFFMPSSHPSGPNSKTIAVLPFTNMSGNPEEEYFSDGITDDILTQLCKVADLNVISRMTMMQYKGSKKKLREIGEELNAGVVLEGSVRRSGNRLRITGQLIDAVSDRHLWAETYDREMKDVFEIQSEIAQKIASALQSRLSSAEKMRLSNPTTTNTEAYNAFLQGQFFYNRRSKENMEKALGYYEQALRIDPNYARAWACLSWVHSAQADNGYVPVDEGYRKARQEAEKALQLDPNLAIAYSAIGWIKWSYDWDWTGADASFRRARELEPGSASVVAHTTIISATLGRFDEAIRSCRRAIAMDPLRTFIHSNLGVYTFYVGRLEESEAAFRKVLELDPFSPGTHRFLGLIYLARSKPEQALSEMQKDPEPGWRMYGLALAYHAMGKKKEADAALEEYIKKYQNDAAFQVAEIYAYRGKTDKAFEWLERAYRQRDGGLSEMKGDPLLKNLEHDPRYAGFMKKMGLPL